MKPEIRPQQRRGKFIRQCLTYLRICSYANRWEIRLTWKEVKAKRNLRKHGISFDIAENVFNDPHVVIYFDCETAEGEMRYHAIGYITEQLMAVVVYIDLSQNDDEHIHLLSARKAEAFEESIYADQFR